MDLLNKRYSASPFLMLEEYIEAGCFAEFIENLIDIVNEETENETLWDFYLHKVHDKTYQAFLDEIKSKPVEEKPVDFGAVINESMNILEGYVPE